MKFLLLISKSVVCLVVDGPACLSTVAAARRLHLAAEPISCPATLFGHRTLGSTSEKVGAHAEEL